jgi:PucR family transcriptional regulator, purine catabolism regulatory protein
VNITVSEALQLPALKDAMLIAGRSGTGRIISSVNMMEVPGIINYVKRDELLVTTTYPIKDDPEAQARLVPGLVERGVAALAIKPVFYHDTVPELMVKQADALGLPLIQLPKDASFNDILNPVLAEILNRQAVVLRRNEEVHKSFTDLVLKGGSLADIANMLARLQNNPVSLHAPRFRLLAFGVPRVDPPAPTSTLIAGMSRDAGLLCRTLGDRAGPAVIEDGGARLEVYVHRVIVEGDEYGSVIVWLESGTPYEINVIEQAVTVMALEIVKHSAVSEVERRYKTFFVQEIINGGVGSRADAISRGAAYGWDLSTAFVPVLIEIRDAPSALGAQRTNRDASRTQRRLASAVVRSTALVQRDPVVVDFGARMLVLLKADANASREASAAVARSFCGHVQRELAGEKERAVSCGIGRVVDDILALATGFSQADQALAIGRATRGAGAITHFDELGVYRALATRPLDAELVRFSEEILAALRISDQEHHTAFLATLETLLDANFNLKQTARKMSLHYNTVRYRVGQIEALTGLDLASGDARLNLHLALKVERIRHLSG